MADEIILKTWAAATVAPVDDAVIQEVYTGDGGIISGATVTIKDANTLHITGGYGAICGREFQIFASDIPVVLSSSGNLNGRLYIHMDLSQSTNPIQLLTEVAASLTPCVQDADVNLTNGIFEINLATFTVGTSAISGLADVAPKLVGIESSDLTSIKAVGSTNATGATITKGTYFYLNGKLCLAKSDIANGATFTLNTNYEVVTAGGLNSLNSALTDANCKIGAEIVSPVTWNKEGWTPLNNIDNIVTPPALSGYSCIGFIIKQTSTYRIIAPYVYYSSGSWNIAFYAVNTSATSGTISMYPIYRKN